MNRNRDAASSDSASDDASRQTITRLGLIVNPIAGMGGRVGLHGTDGALHEQAKERGATPVAPKRAARAMRRLAASGPNLEVWAGSRCMGETIAKAFGVALVTIPVLSNCTTSEDTKAVAKRMKNEEVDLILFAGGDGTARDIVDAIGAQPPILGIPTGVKMHSPVFGVTPEAAGEVAARFLRTPSLVPTQLREVMDADVPGGNVAGFAVASVPYVGGLIQWGKAAASLGGDSALELLCTGLADNLEPDHVYVIGPGTTTARILDRLHLHGELTGVNVLMDRQIIVVDASEAQLLEILDSGHSATIVLGVVGGQGFLLGRGNQQISPAVVKLVGEENVLILASEEKIRSLNPPVLSVDAGIDLSQPVMLGYRRVHTAPGKSVVMKVVAYDP